MRRWLLPILALGAYIGAAVLAGAWHDHEGDHTAAGHECVACHWNLHATTDLVPATAALEFSAVTFPAPQPVAADVPVILCPHSASRAPPEAV